MNPLITNPSAAQPSVIDRTVSAYSQGQNEEFPLGGYAVLMAAFGVAFGSLLGVLGRHGGWRRPLPASDVVLVGIATHKLTRIVTRDWVTSPLRAPFTRYEGSDGGGEVLEKARGRGLQRAVGDLLSCQFCTGPWIASGLAGGLLLRERPMRFVVNVLCAVTVSDFLHQIYAKAKKLAA